MVLITTHRFRNECDAHYSTRVVVIICFKELNFMDYEKEMCTRAVNAKVVCSGKTENTQVSQQWPGRICYSRRVVLCHACPRTQRVNCQFTR